MIRFSIALFVCLFAGCGPAPEPCNMEGELKCSEDRSQVLRCTHYRVNPGAVDFDLWWGPEWICNENSPVHRVCDDSGDRPVCVPADRL